MRIAAVLALWLAFVQPALAYFEFPPFEQTRFARDYGMFRWYRGCWFKVKNAYVYVICDPDGDVIERLPLDAVPDLIASGVLPADSATGRLVDRLLGRIPSSATRWGSSRLSAAPGDGTPLSGYYGGTFFRFDGHDSGSSGVFRFDANGRPIASGSSAGGYRFDGGSTFGYGSYGGFSSGYEASAYGGSGFPFSGPDDGTQRIFGGEVPTSGGGQSSAFTGGDGFFSSDQGTRMHDVFYEPLGLFTCDDIHDSIDGGLFGPIPCTSYRGVFGPKVEY